MTLRKRLIRLAAERPEFRADLLPLLEADKVAAKDLASWQGEDGKWYRQEKGGYDDADLYFYPTQAQKNGGAKGILKSDERAGQAKQTSISKVDMKVWKEVPEAQVPDQVKSKVRARL